MPRVPERDASPFLQFAIPFPLFLSLFPLISASFLAFPGLFPLRFS